MISASLIILIQVYAKSLVIQVTCSGHHLTFSWFIIGDQASNPIRTYLAESQLNGNITAIGSYHWKSLTFLPMSVADRGISEWGCRGGL